MRNAVREGAAGFAAVKIREALNLPETRAIETGLVLGTGWGDAVNLEGAREVAFQKIPGFKNKNLEPMEGHARKVLFGQLGGKDVLALKGRVHLNEAPADPEIHKMVRLQIEMLIKLGIKNLILTCAAGSLLPQIEVGDVMIIQGLVTLYAPEMPLYVGEFCSPEDTLDPRLAGIASTAAEGQIPCHDGGNYAMVRGPFFEGRRCDKGILRSNGASVVGMSMVPEMCVASLYNEFGKPRAINVLGICFVTNTDQEVHSHAENVARAKASSSKLGELLARIVNRI